MAEEFWNWIYIGFFLHKYEWTQQTFLFVLDDIIDKLPTALQDTFQLAGNSHVYSTRSTTQYKVIPPVKICRWIKKYYHSRQPLQR